MKFNLKWISVLLILFFISVSAVSAHDAAQLNDTVSEIVDADEITSINEIGESTLTADTNNYYALQRAIWNAQAGDTITLTEDYTYDGNDRNYISIDRTLTIDGNGHTLNGQNAAYISIGASNVVIKNVKFINNYRDWGAIVNYGDSLTLDNCTFMNNRAGSGGVVYLSGTNSVTITNCRFESNVADYGGAIRMNGGSATITNNKFIENKANNAGGAIYVEEGSITLNNNTFSKSTAGSNGGATYIFGASATITDNKFTSNTAAELAGALFINTNNGNVKVNVKNNEFKKSTAGKSGGAAYIEGSDITLEKNIFTGNHANDLGGAIRWNGKNGKITENQFESNDANNGGAIYAQGAKTTISNCKFENNNATYDFGGAYIEGLSATVTNNKFTSNTAGKIAGALFIKGNKATIKNNEFTRNTVPLSGGAIRIEGDSNVISNNNFTGNEATDTLGGAICSLGHNNQFTYNTFIDNVAGRDGGAIFTEGTNIEDMGHNNTISYNIFIGNQVIGNPEGCHGGAISMAGEDCAINYNNFTDNHAYNIGGPTSIGGAIRWNGGNSAMGDIIGNRFNGNDAQSGGAIYITGDGINIAENIFNENEATDYFGGSLNIVGNNPMISSNEFTNSKSKQGGGGIHVNGENTQFQGNTLTNCSSGTNGGGAYLEGSGTVSNSRFTGCSATQNGGGIFANTNYKIEGTVFKDNTAANAPKYYPTNMPITKLSTILTVTDVSAAYGSNNYITATLKDTSGNPISGESIGFENNGVKETITTDADGNAKYYTSELAPGSYSIKVTFNGNDAYNAATSVTSNVVISKVDIIISAVYNDTDKEIVATLTDNATGNTLAGADVEFNINGIATTVESDSEGKATASTADLPAGTYTAAITYAGNSIYNPASTSITFDAKSDKLNTTLTADDVTTTYNSGANITATLKDENGTAVSNVEITFKIGSTTLTAITDANGVAAVSADGINPNTYTANIVFSGNNNYNGTTAIATITINKANTKIDTQDVSVIYKDKTGELIATLTNNATNKPINGANVVININSENYALKTNDEGQVKLSTTDLPLGTNTATITYAGNSKFNPASTTANVIVTKADMIITASYNDANKEIVATLTNNASGKTIANANVKVELNGETTTVKSNTIGQITVSTADLPTGTYTAIITYAGNTIYNPASTNITFYTKSDKLDTTITADDLTTTYNSGANITATLKDENGNAINNAQINIQIGNTNITATTDNNGVATASTDSLTPNTYNAIIAFTGNDLYNGISTTATITINKANTKIDAPNVSVIYKDKTGALIATLTDNATGKTITNANINVNLNGENNTIKTDSKGEIKVSTSNLPYGTNMAIISYAGDDNYNPSSITANITVTKADMIITASYNDANKEIVATLTNNASGKTIANANVKVELNGETTTVKSNSTGQITVSTADLPTGTYTATISYPGNTIYNPTSTNITFYTKSGKSNTTLTADDVTTTYNSGANITATLKDENGNAINNAQINIQIGNTNITATTDNNGVATASTDSLTPNTYNAIIAFTGNDLYNGISTTATITINKANTKIDAPNVSVIYKDKTGALIATLTDNATGKTIANANINVNLNGENNTIKTDNEGQVKVSTANLPYGTYTAIISYAGDDNYNPSTSTAEVTVTKADMIIDAVYNAANSEIVATLTNNASGKTIANANVKVELNGETTTVKSNSKGQVIVSTANLPTGTYTATISYPGNTIYNPASTSIDFSTKNNMIISAVYNAANSEIVATLTNNASGKLVSNANVKVELNGETTTVKSNSKGQVIVSTADLPMGTYTATISYAGNAKYNPANTSITFTTKTDMIIDAVYDGANKQIVATLTNGASGKTIANANVKVNLNGETTTAKSNSKGQIIVSTADLPIGTYTATISYAGNAKYNPASTSIDFSTKAVMIISDIYGSTTELTATLTNSINGKKIANANIVVNINGVATTVKSNSKGQIKVPIANLTGNTYTATISYKGNAIYDAVSTTATVNVEKTNMIITSTYDAGNKQIVATLTNSATGKNIQNVNIKVNLNGVTTTVKSNGKGQVIVPTSDLDDGTYTAILSYPGNSIYNPSSTVVKVDV